MIEPLISLTVKEPHRLYVPGDELEFEFQIDAVKKNELMAVESSVMWYTEGKGDEDLGVHFFERRTPAEADNNDLRLLRRVQIICPNSPLSYSGDIVKILWCVRVRAFLKSGKEVLFELPFVLKNATEMKERVERP